MTPSPSKAKISALARFVGPEVAAIIALHLDTEGIDNLAATLAKLNQSEREAQVAELQAWGARN
jgi:glycine cleavage system regulatory protein